jgi:hypothetical protein
MVGALFGPKASQERDEPDIFYSFDSTYDETRS